MDLPRNPLLFGRAASPGIVAVELGERSTVRLYRREADGRTRTESRPFRPFALVADPKLLEGFGEEHRVVRLEGDRELGHLVELASVGALGRLRDHLRRRTSRGSTAADAPYWLAADLIEQYLLRSGETLFGGLTWRDLRVLTLDIETYCEPGFEFSNPSRAGDRIIAIALADSEGQEWCLRGDRLDEPGLLRELARVVAERDPDVILGHNLFRFDLEYIVARAERHRIPLPLGRDGSPVRARASRLQIAERAITYRRFDVRGRHIVDTYILAQHHDVATRELASLGLKDVAQALGVAARERTYVDPRRIAWHFDHDREPLWRYALDDVRETRALGDLLAPAFFTQAQIFPFSLQNVVLRGNATKIDALVMREYLHRAHSVPLPERPVEVAGGYTEIFRSGIARDVAHCDVASMYPSLMLSFGYFPERDDLGIFRSLLADLRELRLAAKERAARAQGAERVHLQALQATFKILINSFYGYLGFPLGHWNDYAAAARITAKGRELLRFAVDWLAGQGFAPIEIDTDGIYFSAAPTAQPARSADDVVAELDRRMPAGIRIELDATYPAMLSYKVKNYALLDAEGRLVVKGSGLRSRGLEGYLRRWIAESMRVVLAEEDPARAERQVREATQATLDAIAAHRLPITELAKTETLRDSLETYRAKRRSSARNVAAAYELALETGRSFEPGDQISFYVIGTSPTVRVNEAAKLVARWEPAAPDENVAYYQAKLLDLFDKLAPTLGLGCRSHDLQVVPEARREDRSRDPGSGEQLELFGDA